MALELRQQLKLVQKLVMTPQLRQAIKLLQLNRLELTDALHAEIEQNPALEEDLGQNESSELPQSLSATLEDTSPAKEQDITERVSTKEDMAEINWSDYANNFDSNFSFARETPPADAPTQFDFISEKPGLSAYLQWQLAHCDLDQKEYEVAQFLVGNLNRYGFLETDIAEVVAKTESDTDEVDYLIEVIQDLDPPGIGARNVSESLFLQLERKGMATSLAAEIVLNHLPLLQTKNYKVLAKNTGHQRNEVVRAVTFITRELTPFPGLPLYSIYKDRLLHAKEDYGRWSFGEVLIRPSKLSLRKYYYEILKTILYINLVTNNPGYMVEKFGLKTLFRISIGSIKVFLRYIVIMLKF